MYITHLYKFTMYMMTLYTWLWLAHQNNVHLYNEAYVHYSFIQIYNLHENIFFGLDCTIKSLGTNYKEN